MIISISDKRITPLFRLAPFIIPAVIILFCRTTAGIKCGDIPAALCREMVLTHELYSGELTGSTVQPVIHGGISGIWINNTSFRTASVTEIKFNKRVPLPEEISSCGSLSDKSLAGLKSSVLQVFKEIYGEQLPLREGIIEYDLSGAAFEKEAASIIKSGVIVKHEHSAGRCRVIFQVSFRCLKEFVYSGNSVCGD